MEMRNDVKLKNPGLNLYKEEVNLKWELGNWVSSLSKNVLGDAWLNVPSLLFYTSMQHSPIYSQQSPHGIDY